MSRPCSPPITSWSAFPERATSGDLQKLGLPNYIIETAKERSARMPKTFEDPLAELEQSRQQLRVERKRTPTAPRLSGTGKESSRTEKQFEKRREELLQKANEEARDILARAKERVPTRRSPT